MLRSRISRKTKAAADDNKMDLSLSRGTPYRLAFVRGREDSPATIVAPYERGRRLLRPQLLSRELLALWNTSLAVAAS